MLVFRCITRIRRIISRITIRIRPTPHGAGGAIRLMGIGEAITVTGRDSFPLAIGISHRGTFRGIGDSIAGDTPAGKDSPNHPPTLKRLRLHAASNEPMLGIK